MTCETTNKARDQAFVYFHELLLLFRNELFSSLFSPVNLHAIYVAQDQTLWRKTKATKKKIRGKVNKQSRNHMAQWEIEREPRARENFTLLCNKCKLWKSSRRWCWWLTINYLPCRPYEYSAHSQPKELPGKGIFHAMIFPLNCVKKNIRQSWTSCRGC